VHAPKVRAVVSPNGTGGSMRYFLALFVTSFLGFAQHAAAQQTFALKCRSGSGTSFDLSEAGELRFGFTRASVAAGPDGSITLKPGECAWVDRPVNANEPNAVAAPLSQNFKVGAAVPHAFNNSFKAYIYSDPNRWVSDFYQYDTILTIYVYNDGNYLRAPPP
jgi:hypothetical protein